MPTIMLVNPLKPEKLTEYKAFMAEYTGPRNAEYKDMLKRYGLKSTQVYYHKIGKQEFVIVTHEQEAGKEALLGNWLGSTHPFDVWFKEQLANLHDFEFAGMPETMVDFKL